MTKANCLCGKLRVNFNQEPQMMVKCHCRDCQYISGGEASPLAFFVDENVAIEGEPKTYTRKGGSDKEVHRSFCPDCGTHLFSRADSAPGLIFAKVGTLEKEVATQLKTAMVFFSTNAYPFCQIDEGAQVFETTP